MSISERKSPPGTVHVKSSEERWQEYRKDGGFGATESKLGDDTAAQGQDGAKKTKGKGKPGQVSPAALDVSHVGATPTLQVGGSAAGDASAVLPTTAETGKLDPAMTEAAALAAASLPVTNRQVQVQGSAELTAAATPLSKAVDKLSDHLAQGVTDEATLTQDFADYTAAMQEAGLTEMIPEGLHIMVQQAGLAETAGAQVTKLAQSAGIDVAKVAPKTLAQAKEALVKALGNDKTDAGLVDLHLSQVKTLATAAGDPAAAAEVVDEAVAKGQVSKGSNLAALYAAAAKNGVDLSDSTEDKVDAAKNSSAQGQAERARKDAARESAAQSTQQGGGGGGTGGGGGSTYSNSSTKAPTYDPVAAASPYGAKENLSAWKQNVYPKGQFNNEQQHYTDGNQNISFGADGSATITARNEGNGDWSSARITGDPVGDLPKYLEATMQNPNGMGTWPAFWLVGPGSWPQGGEIDVMENVDGNKELVTSNHWGDSPVGSAGEMPHWSPSASYSDIDMTQPHRYGVMVTETGTQFYLDGKKIGEPVAYPPEANFSKIAREMVPTINLAMGGTWPSDVPGDLPDQTLKVLSMTRSNKAPDET